MQTIFENLLENITDNAQMMALFKYCSRVDHVTIVGFGTGMSTLVAMAAGPKTINIYDHQLYDISEYKQVAEENGIQLDFYNQMVLSTVINPTDLMFADSFAEGNFVYNICFKNHHQVSRYMLVNNTVKFAHKADTNVQMSDPSQAIGIVFGLNSFIQQIDNWHIAENFYWEPGITALYNRRDLTDHGR